MANITYKKLNGQARYISSEEFDNLNLSEEEVGTEYRLVGWIGEEDLDAELQTKINGKLDAPTTSGKNWQVLTMAASGKPYWRTPDDSIHSVLRHCVQIIESNPNKVLYFWVDATEAIAGEIQNLVDLVGAIMVDKSDSLGEFFYPCTGRWGASTDNIVVTGCLFTVSSVQPTIKLYLSDGSVTDSLSTENLGIFLDTIITL